MKDLEKDLAELRVYFQPVFSWLLGPIPIADSQTQISKEHSLDEQISNNSATSTGVLPNSCYAVKRIDDDDDEPVSEERDNTDITNIQGIRLRTRARPSATHCNDS